MPIPAARRSNTSKGGSTFSEATVNAVWNKGRVDPRYDSNRYRSDVYGSWIEKSAYGTLGKFGWEIDHIKPVAAGGGDELSNLQPLFWKNNRSKGDDW